NFYFSLRICYVDMTFFSEVKPSRHENLALSPTHRTGLFGYLNNVIIRHSRTFISNHSSTVAASHGCRTDHVQVKTPDMAPPRINNMSFRFQLPSLSLLSSGTLTTPGINMG
ncbi:hypothetical protein L9F63_013869, partial [Diploptera punctata]